MCAKKRKKINTPKRDTTDWTFDPVKREVGGEEAEKVIWSTKALEAAVKALNEGLPLKVNPFCGKDTQLLKPELLYRRIKEARSCLFCIKMLFNDTCRIATM